MGLWPTQGMKIADNLRLCPSPVTAAVVSAPLPFVIPSEAEGSAVQRTPLGNVFSTDRSEVEDLELGVRRFARGRIKPPAALDGVAFRESGPMIPCSGV